VLILPRGAGERLDWVHSIDPHLGYSIDITQRNRFEVTADIFNVFNFQATTRVDETFTVNSVAPIPDGSRADVAGCANPARGACNLRNADGTAVTPGSINPNFGKATRYQEPLTVRFGARMTF
jgi:hypothetical protein